MRYLVLAREDLTNQVEGRVLQNKTTASVCQFLIEEVICRYGCVGKIVANRGELDAQEAEELFDRLGVKLSLTTAYNPEANGKVEREHGPIVKALVRACCWRQRTKVVRRKQALASNSMVEASRSGNKQREDQI
jgi:hypothetical protein